LLFDALVYLFDGCNEAFLPLGWLFDALVYLFDGCIYALLPLGLLFELFDECNEAFLTLLVFNLSGSPVLN